MPFPYKTALITGATSGIGRALAERMVAAGIFVIAVGRRKDRLAELVAKHGSSKVAAEECDVSDLAGLPAWTKQMVAKFPTLDCVVLNAGQQAEISFTPLLSATTSPQTAVAAKLSSIFTAETNTNYLSPVHTALHLLPHLSSLPSPTAILLVSSGLALVPLPKTPSYCATKAALHSFAWTLRSQLTRSSPSMRVIEIIPPAVQTELHTVDGRPAMGMPLGEYVDEVWGKLQGDGEEEEIMVESQLGLLGGVEERKREVFGMFERMMRGEVGRASTGGGGS